LDLHEVPLTIPGLPRAFDGFRMAQISDMHAGPNVPMDYLARVIGRVNDAAPDLVVVTGDIVNHSLEAVAPSARLLGTLRAPVIVIFGNHDYSRRGARPGGSTEIANPLEAALNEAGCAVLRNRSDPLERDGATIYFAGLEDYWSAFYSPRAAFDGLDPSQTIICLSHNPDSVASVAPLGPRLILSGHTHGGQVRVPFLGAPILPTNNRKYDQGLFDVGGGVQLYVSRGVGFLARVRFCCRPEVPIFKLTAA
ncbi:MAG: metallophosphoesterase, partial [Tepidisphaeraceae bacterium]